MFRKIIDEIGPALAGFQIAVSIIGYFAIGAIAKWIIENWFPFTRWVWDELFQKLNLPDLSVAEKDALTTVAFFMPMAISSVYSWREKNMSKSDEVISENIENREARYRIYAALIGAFFMIVVGGSVINDVFVLFGNVGAELTLDEEKNKHILDPEFFANFGLIISVLTAVMMIAFALYWLIQRSSRLDNKTKQTLEKVSRRAKPIFTQTASTALASTLASIVSALTSLLSFGTMLGGIIASASQLGFIRTASPILILLSLITTVFLHPKRLLQTAGVVVALIVASVGWDAAVFVVKMVESVPK